MTPHYCQTSGVSIYEYTGEGVGEMAQEEKISVVRSDSKDLINRTQIVVGKKQPQKVVPWPPGVTKTLMIVHTNTENKSIKV